MDGGRRDSELFVLYNIYVDGYMATLQWRWKQNAYYDYMYTTNAYWPQYNVYNKNIVYLANRVGCMAALVSDFIIV